MFNKLCPETTALISLYKNETELSYRKIALQSEGQFLYILTAPAINIYKQEKSIK
jgi:hypothetical protein